MAVGNRKGTDESKGGLWGFVVVGAFLLLAGLSLPIPGAPPSLAKAEILTGAFLLLGSIAALVITW